MEHKQINLTTSIGIAATRISSTRQHKQGDSPEEQKLLNQNRANSMHCKIVKWFTFVESASGVLQPSQEAIDYCKANQGKIQYFFIKSIDRFTRGGSYSYDHLNMQLTKYGVQLIDAHGVIGTQTVNTLDHLNIEYSWSKYNPTRVSELLTAERGKDEVRDILTRMIGAEIRYVRMGYRVRSAPYGYKNEKIDTDHGTRVILTAHSKEAFFIIKIFELRIQGNMTDEEIVKQINLLGFKSRRTKIHDSNNSMKILGYEGENPLTLKQLQRYLQSPIYAGINTEKWTSGKPVKGKFKGLISVEMFNRANKGKVTIFEDNDMVYVYKGQIPQWQLIKNKENPLYPYKNHVHCPICVRPLLGSASRGKLGKYYAAYHCNRGHYFRVALPKFKKTIKEFCMRLKFSGGFKKKFTEILLEEWEKREVGASNKTITFNERLIRIEQEKQLHKETIKQLSSPVAIKMIEEDIEKLEQEKLNLIPERDNKEIEQLDIQKIINFMKYFMEHPQELLLGGADKVKNAAMFGLVFDVPPTYENLTNGTPQLSPLFALNEKYERSKSLSVSLQGLEP